MYSEPSELKLVDLAELSLFSYFFAPLGLVSRTGAFFESQFLRGPDGAVVSAAVTVGPRFERS